MTSVHIREAAGAFCRDGATCSIERLGEGNINDTFLVKSAASFFVLQKINAAVFPEPLRVVENFMRITEHLRQKRGQEAVSLLTAAPVPTMKGESHYLDGGGGCWRGQTYLAGAVHSQLPDDCLRRAGRTLAIFHFLAADLEVARLSDPLPGFHHLPAYMAELDRILAGKPRQLEAAGEYCLLVIDRLRPMTSLLEDARQAGLLPMQPMHGDPKIDNFIFSAAGDQDGLLDFDTVGPGLAHYDLGDCLRSCCNRAGERGDDPAAVSFDLECCRLLLQGYFMDRLTFDRVQQQMIFEAVLLISFELGVRFFTDHLRGNTYFRVAQDGINLARAIRQFRLVEDIAAKERAIRRIIEEAAGRPVVQSSSSSSEYR